MSTIKQYAILQKYQHPPKKRKTKKDRNAQMARAKEAFANSPEAAFFLFSPNIQGVLQHVFARHWCFLLLPCTVLHNGPPNEPTDMITMFVSPGLRDNRSSFSLLYFRLNFRLYTLYLDWALLLASWSFFFFCLVRSLIAVHCINTEIIFIHILLLSIRYVIR